MKRSDHTLVKQEDKAQSPILSKEKLKSKEVKQFTQDQSRWWHWEDLELSVLKFLSKRLMVHDFPLQPKSGEVKVKQEN